MNPSYIVRYAFNHLLLKGELGQTLDTPAALQIVAALALEVF